MAKLSRPRKGSLQFYPRKRAAKFVHSVNWKPISSNSQDSLLGFITYKVGMATAIVKDLTDKSPTAKKKIVLPVTILEAPAVKIFSVRFYKFNKPIKDIIVSNDKELKRKLKLSKSPHDLSKIPQNYDDIKILIYSLPKQTSVKKTPDFIEIAISGKDKEQKLNFIKSQINKEIPVFEFLKSIDKESNLLDVRGVTKGKGFSGPVKRFGVNLRHHKSEKGVRKVGSLGPWHPARVTFRTPIAGQLGLFSRISYNHKLINSSLISEKDINPIHGFKNYGKIRTSYIILKGSVPGPAKRAVILTPSFRATKYHSKKKLEFLELITK